MRFLRNADYRDQIAVRNIVRDQLRDGEVANGRVFDLAEGLLEVNSEQHSDDLLRPILDFAVSTEDEEMRIKAGALFESIHPSPSALESNASGLRALGSLVELPGAFAHYSSGASESS